MVDGHPDALDGKTSPTGEAADMDLALVLGRGHPELTRLAGDTPMVEPENVASSAIARPSSTETSRTSWRRCRREVEQTTALEVRRRGAGPVAWATLASKSRGRPVWLHVDLDALDERELPAVTYAQPQGLSWAQFVELLEPLVAAPDLAGMSLTDLDADHAHARQHAGRIVDALQSAFSGARAAPYVTDVRRTCHRRDAPRPPRPSDPPSTACRAPDWPPAVAASGRSR